MQVLKTCSWTLPTSESFLNLTLSTECVNAVHTCIIYEQNYCSTKSLVWKWLFTGNCRLCHFPPTWACPLAIWASALRNQILFVTCAEYNGCRLNRIMLEWQLARCTHNRAREREQWCGAHIWCGMQFSGTSFILWALLSELLAKKYTKVLKNLFNQTQYSMCIWYNNNLHTQVKPLLTTGVI